MIVSNCSGERSSSKLKFIKNELRNGIGQDRLNSLSIMSIESDVLRQLDCSQITLGNKKIFLSLAQIVGAFLEHIGVAKSENELSFAELARVFEMTSLAKLQNCKIFKFFYRK